MTLQKYQTEHKFACENLLANFILEQAELFKVLMNQDTNKQNMIDLEEAIKNMVKTKKVNIFLESKIREGLAIASSLKDHPSNNYKLY